MAGPSLLPKSHLPASSLRLQKSFRFNLDIGICPLLQTPCASVTRFYHLSVF